MRKLFFLFIIGLAGWYVYQHTGIFKGEHQGGAPSDNGPDFIARLRDQVSGDSEKPAAGTAAPSATTPAAPAAGAKELIGCNLLDENGNTFDFGSFLGRNRDKVVMLCVDIANRPHCAAGGDDNMRAHYRLIEDLQGRYGDRVQVVGYNFSGSLEQVRAYKSYYGFDYPMLTFPQNATASSAAEAQQMKAFFESFNGITCPAVMFIKDGRHIVKTVSDVKDDPALEGMLSGLL